MKRFIRDIMAGALVDALRQGVRGPAYDGALLGRAWGFRLEDITFASVYLWHGERDRMISVAVARALVDAIPHCTTTYYPDDSHISLIVNHAQEIVTRVLPDLGKNPTP